MKLIKYIATLGTAATIILTPGCLEQKVDEYQVPPQLDSDSKGMSVNYEQPDTEPVVSSQTENEIKLLFYSITPAHENYY